MNVNTDPDFWNWVLDHYEAFDIIEDADITADNLLEAYYDKIYQVYGKSYRGDNDDDNDDC